MKTKTPKMGFFVLAKQGLRKHGILKTNLVSNWGGPVGKKEGEKKRKKKRRSGDHAKQAKKVWNLDFLYGNSPCL